MYSTIILAAGSGERVGLSFNKVLLEVHNQEIIKYSIDFFNKDIDCNEIILVVSKTDFKHMTKQYGKFITKIVVGGSTRQESVYNALRYVKNKYVFIHDGARPFISNKTVTDLKKYIVEHVSVTPVIKMNDTIKEVVNDVVVKTLDRSFIYRVQTPQAFHTSKIIEAHNLAIRDKFHGTDDTLLVEKYLKEKTFVVEGDIKNIKLTTKDDLLFLEVIL